MHGLETFLANYGPIVVLVGTLLEGEIIVLVAGFAAHQGLMSPYAVAFCAFVGTFAADQAIFHVARRQSERPWMEQLRRRPAFARAMHILRRHPSLFILSFRFLYGLRTVGPAAIGAAGVPSSRFLALNAVAAACWAAVYTFLGYTFGQAAEAAFGELQRFEHRALAAIAVAVPALLLGQLVRKLVLRRAAAPSE
jgi:membrane protein DedA with SNARE-associated domain